MIDLQTNSIKGVHFRELIGDGYTCCSGSEAMVSLKDGNHLYRPVSNLWDPSHVPVLTMDGVLTREWMGMSIPRTIGWLLQSLERGLGFAVDVEFAICVEPENEEARLYVLQTRPLSQAGDRAPQPIPSDLGSKDIICRVSRALPTSHVQDIEYLIYVDDLAYNEWPHNQKQTVARVIGKLNEALKDRRFGLIGPGRWGSWNPELGVPVRYSEICHAVLLVEVARRRATYVPEVSFGSHFFQDLIEDNIAYLPVYPDEPNEDFSESIFDRESCLSECLSTECSPELAKLIKVLHLPSVAGNRKAHAILNGDLNEAVVFLR